MKVIPLVWDEHTYEFKNNEKDKNVKKKDIETAVISAECLLLFLLMFAFCFICFYF